MSSNVFARGRRGAAGWRAALWGLALFTAAGWIAWGQKEEAATGPNILAPLSDATGVVRTVSKEGHADSDNPFFVSLGTNGRACVTCHQPAAGWTLSPAEVRRRFERTQGLDPLFRPNDGSNSPWADVSTVEDRRRAYSMLLSKGLIRVGMAIPKDAEFTLESVDDPYRFASAQELSLFRRPLPATNLRFLSAVMWDGRETFPDRSIVFDLMDQANGATLGHAQASLPLTPEEQREIVDFETSLSTAQVYDMDAGELDARGAGGGPKALALQEYYLGINDVLGQDPEGHPFTPIVFTDFAPWARFADRNDREDQGAERGRNAARAAVARGEALFNAKPIRITGVKGLNDDLGRPVLLGTCGTCHDSPNVGNHSLSAPLDIGLTDASRRTPDLPLYTLRNRATGETVSTSDPGRALVTGRWKDVGRFKGPVLRGLAARAPYFHNGSAATLADVVGFYDSRFEIGLTDAEKADLVAFLRAQ